MNHPPRRERRDSLAELGGVHISNQLADYTPTPPIERVLEDSGSVLQYRTVDLHSGSVVN